MRTVETSILGAPLEELHKKRGAAPIFDFFFLELQNLELGVFGLDLV